MKDPDFLELRLLTRKHQDCSLGFSMRNGESFRYSLEVLLRLDLHDQLRGVLTSMIKRKVDVRTWEMRGKYGGVIEKVKLK